MVEAITNFFKEITQENPETSKEVAGKHWWPSYGLD